MKNSKKWISFAMMMLGAGTIYKLYFMSDAFYVQMEELWGLTNTQIGIIYSVTGWISTFGFLVAIYLTDRFSKKRLIPFAMICNGVAGLALTLRPAFPVMLALFCVFAVCADMLFWPTMLKTVRLLGGSEEQGRMFGFLETGRGLIDTVVNAAALGIFALLGSTLLGFQAGLVFFSALTILIGIGCFFLLEDDAIASAGSAAEKNRETLKGVVSVLKNPDVWMVSINVFFVYAVYSGIKYFAPYLSDVYGLPMVMASAYAILNSYVLKMVGGPIGGFVSDKITHSAARFIRFMFVLVALALVALIAMSGASLSIVAMMCCALLISAFIFCQRAVFFAPMDEIMVSRENSGSAMALGSFIGYLPGAFMGVVYGAQLDAHPGAEGYKIVFIIMAVLAVVGFGVSSLLIRTIRRRKAEKAARQA